MLQGTEMPGDPSSLPCDEVYVAEDLMLKHVTLDSDGELTVQTVCASAGCVHCND